MLFINAASGSQIGPPQHDIHNGQPRVHASGGLVDPGTPTDAVPNPEPILGPSVSEVTLVEVTLLGDLVRILDSTEKHQRALVEQEKLANAHRAALVDAQKAAVAHQAALFEHQRVLAASAVRSELRSFNSVSSHWKPLPLLNGDPFPAQIKHPSNVWSLRRMSEDELQQLAAAYEIGNDDCNTDTLRDSLALFISGKRA